MQENQQTARFDTRLNFSERPAGYEIVTMTPPT